MEKYNIYRDISERTEGDIYIGVVGPVRTGKSTFIKKFMDLLVIPNITNNYRKERAKDELPQSGSGRTIMTTEPKFVPNEAVEIVLDDNATFKVRMVDCVGYLVKDALGYHEGEIARMVNTPWFEHQIPFEEAAEIGTKKVINEHSTIGLMITTDGTITDIPRHSYLESEERVVRELKEINKPFVILLNSVIPYDPETLRLRDELEKKYSVPVMPVNCAHLTLEDINNVLESVLFEFPIKEVAINFPRWVDSLENVHWLKQGMINAVKDSLGGISKIRELRQVMGNFNDYDFVKTSSLDNINLGDGTSVINLQVADGLFYKVLGESFGFEIEGEHQLISMMKDLGRIKREYSKLEEALNEVKEKGYGIVRPSLEELILDEPEIVKHGSKFGIRLRATAPTIHLIKADIETEVSPIIGTEKQSEELVNYLMQEFENDPQKLWDSNIFGKSLYDLVKEGMQNKLYKIPDDAQGKLQETLQRIVNEGSGGLICIIL